MLSLKIDRLGAIVLFVTCAMLCFLCTTIKAQPTARVIPPKPLFAFCYDELDSQHRNLAEQAAMLKELGYAGMSHLWLKDVPERLQTLEAQDLKLFQVVTRISLAPGKPRHYDPALKEVIGQLKGHAVVLSVLLDGLKPGTPINDETVGVLREVAALASAAGLRVCIYPHVKTWTERFDVALKVAEAVDRPNFGVQFNLCHYLKVEGDQDPRPLLKQALPRLFAVVINGADRNQTDFAHLILPLDRGSFDVRSLMQSLNEMGYQGPIGLMCFGLRGNAAVHLRESMTAWRAWAIPAAPRPTGR